MAQIESGQVRRGFLWNGMVAMWHGSFVGVCVCNTCASIESNWIETDCIALHCIVWCICGVMWLGVLHRATMHPHISVLFAQ